MQPNYINHLNLKRKRKKERKKKQKQIYANREAVKISLVIKERCVGSRLSGEHIDHNPNSIE